MNHLNGIQSRAEALVAGQGKPPMVFTDPSLPQAEAVASGKVIVLIPITNQDGSECYQAIRPGSNGKHSQINNLVGADIEQSTATPGDIYKAIAADPKWSWSNLEFGDYVEGKARYQPGLLPQQRAALDTLSHALPKMVDADSYHDRMSPRSPVPEGPQLGDMAHKVSGYGSSHEAIEASTTGEPQGGAKRFFARMGSAIRDSLRPSVLWEHTKAIGSDMAGMAIHASDRVCEAYHGTDASALHKLGAAIVSGTSALARDAASFAKQHPIFTGLVAGATGVGALRMGAHATADVIERWDRTANISEEHQSQLQRIRGTAAHIVTDTGAAVKEACRNACDLVTGTHNGERKSRWDIIAGFGSNAYVKGVAGVGIGAGIGTVWAGGSEIAPPAEGASGERPAVEGDFKESLPNTASKMIDKYDIDINGLSDAERKLIQSLSGNNRGLTALDSFLRNAAIRQGSE